MLSLHIFRSLTNLWKFSCVLMLHDLFCFLILSSYILTYLFSCLDVCLLICVVAYCKCLYVFCCMFFFLLLVYVSFMSDKKTSFYFIFLQKRTSSRNSKTAILTKVGFLHKIWNSTQNNFPWKNISFSKLWKTQVLQNLENTSFWVQQTNQLN